jgi:hypothetical protein
MDMSEDNTSPSVLLRSLQEVPGLRKLKEEHVAALSWKVAYSANRTCALFFMSQHTFAHYTRRLISIYWQVICLP